MLRFFLGALLLCCSQGSFANDLEKFTRYAEYENVRISPDGKHLAVRTTFENRKVLAFLEVETQKLVYLLRLAQNEGVGRFSWVNNERVVANINYFYGPLEQEYRTGTLMAINYDGSKRKFIFGQNADANTGWNTRGGRKISSGSPYVESTLLNDDKYIIVSVSPWKDSHLSRSPADLIRLDVYNGKQKYLMRSPGRGNGFILDNNDQARFAQGISGYDDYPWYYRDVDGEWSKFSTSAEHDKLNIQGFNKDSSKVYFIAYYNGDSGTLYSQDLTTGKLNKIYKNDHVTPRLLRNYKGIGYGVEINEDYSNFLFFNKNVEHAKIHQDLYKSFKGDSVYITSSTSDGSKIIVFVEGDRNPGAYYLFDTALNRAKFLLNTRKDIDPKQMAIVEPFKFKARDGLDIHGYLTLPNNVKDKNLPMVVLPHGGPRSRDYWTFDNEAQLLASQGYAVLQVNFRGSKGYGEKFEDKGNGNWGTKIQYDIVDATKWAINSSIANKDRICIFGISFGAYSAMQSSIIEPDMYKCAIGYSGTYDLEFMYKDGDIPESRYGKEALDEMTSGNNKIFLQQSPVHNVEKLKAPVLLIHGDEDERTPIEHAYRLEKALKKKGHTLKTLYVPNEDHYFRHEDNRLNAAQTIIEFLDEHIGE